MQNLMQLQSQLQALPDAQLQQYMRSQNPNVPPFMVLMEMNRRVQERESQQAAMAGQQEQQEPDTVADGVMAQDAQQTAGPSQEQTAQQSTQIGQNQMQQQQMMQRVATQAALAPHPQGGIGSLNMAQPQGFVDGGIVGYETSDEDYGRGGPVGYDDGGEVADPMGNAIYNDSDTDRPPPEKSYPRRVKEAWYGSFGGAAPNDAAPTAPQYDPNNGPEGVNVPMPSQAAPQAAPQSAPPQGNGGAPQWMVDQIWNKESGNRNNVKDSVDGAVGPGQMMPDTFKQYAPAGADIRDPAANRAASKAYIDHLWQVSGGDPDRVKVGYFSGEGNIAPPDSPTPWKSDVADNGGKGTKVSQYVYGKSGGLNSLSTGANVNYTPYDMGVKPQPVGAAPQQPQAPAGMSADQTIDLGNRMRGLLPDPYPQINSIAAARSARAADMYNHADQDENRIMGYAMGASKSPYLQNAIGEGGLAGIQNTQKQRDFGAEMFDKADAFQAQELAAQRAAAAGDYAGAAKISNEIGTIGAQNYGHAVQGYGYDQAARTGMFGHDVQLQTGMATADARGQVAESGVMRAMAYADSARVRAEAMGDKNLADSYKTASATLLKTQQEVAAELKANPMNLVKDTSAMAAQQGMQRFVAQYPHYAQLLYPGMQGAPQQQGSQSRGMIGPDGNFVK